MLTMMLERPWTDGATSRMELQRAAQRVSLVVRAWWSWEMQQSSPTHFPLRCPLPPFVSAARSPPGGRPVVGGVRACTRRWMLNAL